jgi:very-short-patch-repair endonuclease
MTSLEQAIADSLSCLGFNVAEDDRLNSWHPQYRIGRYSVDFALPSTRIIIEADGDHWHGAGVLSVAQLKKREQDRRKHNALGKQGWIIIRIRERDLQRDNFDQLLNSSILRIIEV